MVDDERCIHDPAFRALVDAFTEVLLNYDWTTNDLEDALHLAQQAAWVPRGLSGAP